MSALSGSGLSMLVGFFLCETDLVRWLPERERELDWKVTTAATLRMMTRF